MKLLAIIEDTFREALARKTIIAFAAISTFFLVIALLVAIFTDMSTITTPQGPKSPTAAISTEQGVKFIEAGLAGFLHFIALLLSIFATAGIITNTMDKGSIDLLLSKPVSRLEIINGKFIGSTLMVLLNVAYFVIGMWLIVSVKSGYWNANFLLVIPVVTVSFIIMYSVIMVIGIASQSSALAIIVSYFFLYLVSPLLASREMGLFKLLASETVQDIVTAVYYILPKPNDFSKIAETLVLHQDISWMPVWSSLLFCVAMYALALFLFKRKDF